MSEIVHANLIATHVAGWWRGVLIEGPSGSGKSDLALRALDYGFRLVADDRVRLWVSDGRLYGGAPEALAHRLEVRGLDVVGEATLPFVAIALLVQCGEVAERIPEPASTIRLGLGLPTLTIAALEPSAPAKLRRALDHLGARP